MIDMHNIQSSVKSYIKFLTLLFLMIFLCFSCLTSLALSDNASPASAVIEDDTQTRARADDFDFDFKYNKITIEPNGDGVAELMITNNIDDDTYSLKILTPPAGWVAVFQNGQDTYSSSVSKDRYAIVPVYLDVPTSGSILLEVTCTSTDSQLKKTASTTIEAKYVITVSVMDKSLKHSVTAGKNTTYSLSIKNYQSFTDTITLSIENKHVKIQNYADSIDWAAMFDNDDLVLNPNENQTIILTVYAPTSGNPREATNIIVVAKSQENGHEFDSPELIIEIPEVYNITYKITKDSPLTLPNSTINYTLKLFNSGNVDTKITLILHKNIGDWGTLFILDGNITTPNKINIKINGFIEFQVQVKIPLDAKSEDHEIVYGIYTDEFGTTHINEVVIVTEVQLISNLDIIIPNANENLIDLGKTSTKEIIIHNKGNGLDVLNISIINESVPIDWTFSFISIRNTEDAANSTKYVDFTQPIQIDAKSIEPIDYLPDSDTIYERLSLVLEANSKVYLTLSITTPSYGKPLTETVRLYGESVSGTIATMTKDLKLTLRVSDLAISELILTPEDPVIGEKVMATFNITNKFHLPATNLRVTLYKLIESEKNIIGSQDVSVIEAGKSESMEFSWTEDRVDGYILEAELSGEISKELNKNPTRNKFVTPVEKTPEKKSDDGLDAVIIILIAIIIVAIIIFIIVGIVMLKQKPTTKSDADKSGNSQDQRIQPLGEKATNGKPPSSLRKTKYSDLKKDSVRGKGRRKR